MKSYFRGMESPPRTKEVLIATLKEAWKNIDMEGVNTVCERMPRRLQKVIDVNGRATGYKVRFQFSHMSTNLFETSIEFGVMAVEYYSIVFNGVLW